MERGKNDSSIGPRRQILLAIPKNVLFKIKGKKYLGVIKYFTI